jgi:hypothetical protein
MVEKLNTNMLRFNKLFLLFLGLSNSMHKTMFVFIKLSA